MPSKAPNSQSTARLPSRVSPPNTWVTADNSPLSGVDAETPERERDRERFYVVPTKNNTRPILRHGIITDITPIIQPRAISIMASQSEASLL